MDFSIVISIVSIIGGISSFILSIFNFVSSKKEMQIKIKMANDDIEFSKIKIEHLDQLTNLSLTEECQHVINYFKKISPNNECKVCIRKLVDDKSVKIASISSNENDERKYSIEENIYILYSYKNQKPYYINNISYFNKRGNKYINSNLDYNKYFQTFIACPIKDKNDTIIGTLSVDIMKPLNDLINTNNITEFLQRECKRIASNKEFNEYNGVCEEKSASIETC